MSRADAIVKRLTGALNKTAPPDRTVYKRVITRTGGDALIGRPGTTTYTDTKLNPQPLYSRLGRFVVGDAAQSELVAGSSLQHVGNDYLCIFSPDAISVSDLENKNLVIVFKDASNVEETFRITDYEPVGLLASAVMFIAYIRTTALPA